MLCSGIDNVYKYGNCLLEWLLVISLFDVDFIFLVFSWCIALCCLFRAGADTGFFPRGVGGLVQGLFFFQEMGPKLNFKQCQHKKDVITLYFENSRGGGQTPGTHLCIPTCLWILVSGFEKSMEEHFESCFFSVKRWLIIIYIL